MARFTFRHLVTLSLVLGLMILLDGQPVAVDAQSSNPRAYGSDENAPINSVFVTQDGSVGINTTDPGNVLDIEGSVVTPGVPLRVKAQGNWQSAIFESPNLASIQLRPAGGDTDRVELANGANGGFRIVTSSASGAQEVFKISRFGNVSIGNPAPSPANSQFYVVAQGLHSAAVFESPGLVGGITLRQMDGDGSRVELASTPTGFSMYTFGGPNGAGIRPFNVTRDGRVGIGINNLEPPNPLHVEANANVLGLEGTDHVYIEFFPDGAATRKAWFGFGNATTNNLTIANEIAGADIVLEPNGGKVSVNVLEITGGGDLAEPFDINGVATIEPGMVVAIDPDNPGQLRLATAAYDRTVAGVVSGAGGIKPGVLMYKDGAGANTHPVALSGRVYVYADASNGPIAPGDLLTTADMPGHAMKVTDYERAQGAILGKAMSKLEEGTGLVLVLVTLQ